MAIVGAGPGLGAAVARRFGTEGFGVALIARSQERVDALAAELADDGVTARGFSADVRELSTLTAALESAAETLGPIEVLQYSPIPQKDFMLPLLETGPADLVGPIEFSIYGPVAAVQHVLPGMRSLGRGTILIVNGGSAVRPAGRVTGTSIAFAGESAYAQMLHNELAPPASTLPSSSFPARSSQVIRGRIQRCSPRHSGACTPSVMAFGISPIPSTADRSGHLVIIKADAWVGLSGCRWGLRRPVSPANSRWPPRAQVPN